MNNNYLKSIKQQFAYYKLLGEKTFEQVPDEMLFWQFNDESNSKATIVKHLWGNMLSSWTDFLASDGEKAFRKRDAEFENEVISREAINRQLAHYPNHVGQIVFLGKMLAKQGLASLSIPKGGSQSFNAEKFSKPNK